MTELAELKATFQLERSDYQSKLISKEAELKELKAKLDMAQAQVNIATHGSGIPSHLVDDVRARMALGLPREEAVTCAMRQWESDIKHGVKAAEQPKPVEPLQVSPLAPVQNEPAKVGAKK